MQLPAYWQQVYWESLNKRIRQGASLGSAHTCERRAWGTGCVRQYGDHNDYGTPNCEACSTDHKCTMCAFAEERHTAVHDLVQMDWVWRDEEDANA